MSDPGLNYGQVPTAAQWNSYFDAKQDVLPSPIPVIQGGTGETSIAGLQVALEQGMTLLNVINLSNQATAQDTTSISSAYNDYFITLDNVVPVTNQVELQLSLQSAGIFQTTGYLNTIGGATSYITLSAGAATVYNGTGTGITAAFYLRNVNSASVNKWMQLVRTSWYTASGAITGGGGEGVWNGGQGAVAGMQFQFGAGNLSSGVIKVYGLRSGL